MKAAGASRIIAIVKEDVDTHVADFRAGYWSGEVFMDSKMAFYKALGGGEERKPLGALAFVAMLANPWSKSRTRASLTRASNKGVEGRLGGEGFITGGVYVVGTDGKAAYVFAEESVGDTSAVDDVIEGVKAAKRGETYNVAPRAFPGAVAESSRKTWKEYSGRADGPDGYVFGDITRGIKASLKRCKKGGA